MPLAKGLSKQCSSCQVTYSLDSKMFSKNCVTADGYQNACKICKAEMSRNWKYGLKNGTIKKMLEDQKGNCVICLKDATKDSCLDHCHISKKVRGVLCRKCNGMLGMINDDVSSLKRAIDYLEKSRE